MRLFLPLALVCCFLGSSGSASAQRNAGTLLANDFVTLYESPDPKFVYSGTPGLAKLPSGRLVATMDVRGRGAEKIVKTVTGPNGKKLLDRGMIFTSDDHGKTWTKRATFPFRQARPFVAGDSLYILGQARDLMIMCSDDDGITWSKVHVLTKGEKWHQSACSVHYANDCIYLVMEKQVDKIDAWPVAGLAPVLMRGKLKDDLLKKESWTFASELAFNQAVDYRKLRYVGVPFFKMKAKKRTTPVRFRNMSPIGWLETNVTQIVDPDHVWFDSNGKTFHLFMRAHTGGAGFAAMCKVVEQKDGSMKTMLETVPSGGEIAFLPMPGGQMRFHILYDKVSKLYWLLSTQATDSMTRIDRLPEDRYSLPNNERQRMQLHFSKNCVDWCFAGLVAKGNSQKESRHYASMVIDGNDLHMLSRSGDHRAKNAHDGNLTTFHTVKDFRKLAY